MINSGSSYKYKLTKIALKSKNIKIARLAMAAHRFSRIGVNLFSDESLRERIESTIDKIDDIVSGIANVNSSNQYMYYAMTPYEALIHIAQYSTKRIAELVLDDASINNFHSLENKTLTDGHFFRCFFNNSNLNGTAFKDCVFYKCAFSNLNCADLTFTNSLFYKTDIKNSAIAKAKFINCEVI